MIGKGVSNTSWFAGICKVCGFNVVITQPDWGNEDGDYWWYCSNKKCIHHIKGEHTYDTESPDWQKWT